MRRANEASPQVPFKGIYPSLITPFNASGEPDLAKLRQYVKTLAANAAVDGIFACGSYGSSALMTSAQRKRVAETIAEETGEETKVMLHVGAANPDVTLDLAMHAQTLGVAAISAITPFYYRHAVSDIERVYTDLLDKIATPLFLYNNPKYTNFATPAPMLARLARAGLAGVKDSSGDIATFYSFIDAVDIPTFSFLIGSQTLLLPALVMGGHGCVSGLSNTFPELVRAIYDAFLAGDVMAAANHQRVANKLRRLTGDGIPVPFYHAVFPMLGIDIGDPHAPFQPLPNQRVDEIRSALDEMGMLG